MTETLQNTIAELLDKFGIAFDGTKTWTVDTLMPYIKELIKRVRDYNIVNNILEIVFFIILMIAAIIFLNRLHKKHKEYKTSSKNSIFFNDYHTGITPLCILGISVSVGIIFLNCIIIPKNILDIIKWIFIPDVQFIEYISQLINTLNEVR